MMRIPGLPLTLFGRTNLPLAAGHHRGERCNGRDDEGKSVPAGVFSSE